MKNLLRLLALVAVCSSLAIAATTPAAPAVDKSKFKTGGCCDKAEKGGKPLLRQGRQGCSGSGQGRSSH
jgi:hypothetical protein